jgi:hypothetical protein
MSRRGNRRQTTPARNKPRGMFLFVLAGIAILAAVLVYASQAASRAETAGEIGPRLIVDQEIIDFGEVKMGQPVTASFTLTNTGDETLRLTNEPTIEVREGC